VPVSGEEASAEDRVAEVSEVAGMLAGIGKEMV